MMTKKIVISIVILLISCSIFSQSPTAIKYQAVARDADNQPLVAQDISLKFSILKGGLSGLTSYSEVHQLRSSEIGVFSINLGEGLPITGRFSNIEWGNDTYFLKVEMDPDGGNNFQLMGTSQFLAVPYALHAQTVERVEEVDGDSSNELQRLSINGNRLSISQGNTITLPSSGNDNDNDPNNEIQQITKIGTNLNLSQGGGVVSIADNDNDDDNEIQQLSLSGNRLTISGGNTITLPTSNVGADGDEDATNEIQRITKSGNNLILSRGGGIVSVADNDNDNDNELQRLIVSGNSLSISQGNTIQLPLLWRKIGTRLYYDGGRVNVGSSNFGTFGLNVQSGIGIYDDNRRLKVKISDLTSGAGYMTLSGSNNNDNLLITSVLNRPNDGWIGVYNGQEENRAQMTILEEGSGYISTTGSNGNINISLSSLSGYSNHGFLAVKDASGTNQVGIYVNSNGEGVVFGDMKSFRMDHPTQLDKEIWYVSLEGPEAAAYERGTAQLVNGEAFITFSSHFQVVANPETMTVQLTPMSAQTYGLGVVEKLLNGFRVQELQNGKGNFQFDWEVKCVRRGYEDFEVIKDKAKEQSSKSSSLPDIPIEK